MTMSFSTSRPSPKQPFRIVVFGPFASDAAGEAAAVLHRVDGSNFDELLARLGGELAVRGPAGAARLRFENLKSLRPEWIARQLPGGPERLAARQILGQLRTRKIGMAAALDEIAGLNLPASLEQAIRAALTGGAEAPRASGAARAETPAAGPAGPQPAATPAAAPPPTADTPAAPPRDDADPLGGLLSMVDVPGEVAPPGPAPSTVPTSREVPPRDPAAAAISAIIGSIAGGAGPPGPADSAAATAAAAALDLVDRDISASVQAILDDPDFRSFEAAWRGLRFLVSRVDFREGVTVEIRHATPESFRDALAEIAAEKAAGALAGDPVSLLVGAFTPPLDDATLSLLTIAGAAAEVIGAPFVTGIDLETAGRVAAGPAWDTFRREPSAEWLGLAVNPFLLRLPFGPETDRVRDFEFVERSDAPLWGSPALAVAVGAARSFARTGWPTLFEGRDNALEDLPVRPTATGQIPTARLIGPDQAATWADAGFIPLVSGLDQDRIFIVRAPSPVADRSIPYKLAQRRLVNLLSGPLAAAGDPRDIEKFGAAVRRELTRVGAGSPDFEIDVAPDSAPITGGVLNVTIRCRPGPPVLASPRDIELHFAFGL